MHNSKVIKSILSEWRTYRMTPDLGLLRCVKAGEASRLIEEIHAGTCGPHMNDMIRVPPNKLNVTSSPWSFAAWGIDVIGPIEQQHLMDTNSFLLQLTTSPSRSKLPLTNRFRIPESIITNNGTNLNSDLMSSLCEKFKISYQNSTAYGPQMNGVVKAANKNIKRILRKMIDNHKHWHEKLPFALLGYRTTIRTSSGATPYFLVYGNEAMIRAEVEIPSLRIIQEAELSDAKWVQVHSENLVLIDGRRINVVCHGHLNQNRMARDFNKKV
ncbi:uncharacterized protein [Solanum tuberosum]|uniref:uncharacterized protein n=1 Tax=Solanum tuberosum TaxID=4113 RepID=UPI00073A2465|nr:PREDICTED: uncharacterized protein LOC107063004 [Solanum tuberosum]